ncbi:MAG: aldehyde ferredoxin oxidoreductase family protein [Bacillota bacterium]
MPGYQGKILRVDLTDKRIWVEEKGEDFYRTYWGGRGIIAYYLLNEVPVGADPLGPENLLVFAAGPMTGLPLAGSGRNSVGGKSPLTGGYGDAEGGGFFGAEMKRAGFDAIVVRGKADKPVYLYIRDGEAEIRDASHLWGKTTGEVEDLIKEETGDRNVRVSQCGPAGEKMVRYACVVNDLTHFCGRTGMGAVMGSKNLRAVAARGTKLVPSADPDTIRDLAKWMVENAPTLAGGMTDLGTTGIVTGNNTAGGLPTRNFMEGQFEGAQKITGTTMRDTILIGRETCYACPVRCKRVVQAEQPWKVDPKYGGPEYESLGSLGSVLGIDDLVAVTKLNEMCAAYGLDSISTGVTLGFAMECFEKGLITKEDTGGLDLRFGNAAAAIEAVSMLKDRQGFGDLLALGSREMAQRIGKGSMEFAMHVRGQEIPMHEPRMKPGLGVGYALSPTGADHCHNFHDTGYAKPGGSVQDLKSLGVVGGPFDVYDLSPEKINAVLTVTNIRTWGNLAVMCQFVPWSQVQREQIARAATGWTTTWAEMLAAAERANVLARVFNLREGMDVSTEVLPKRFFQPFTAGPLAGKASDPEEWERAKKTAYALSGWDENGVPTPERLAKLGVSWATSHLPA